MFFINQKSPEFWTAEKSKFGKRLIFSAILELMSLLYFIDSASIGRTITLTLFNLDEKTLWQVYKALSSGETKIKSIY